ncbi:hypothetical protein QBC34DRAFT_142055 [Podospora aff. communis PSN243]|uniref:RRM domain-containing protein n=1 Tax=Podospora aff. communis PSN243 TaxID=3040156 RepID=A0AAV9GFU4_9PEZI|nr:hypothetical protein QBC34DRAFT_142055 [Podospora aff. communis PSN243]
MVANGANKKVATDFEKIIQEGRDRKKNEALAARIFGKDRRSSAPFKAPASPAGPLSSRAGVKKRSASLTGPRHSTGNINGEWAHDLHESQGPKQNAGSLASRVSNPNLGPAGNPRQKRRAAQVAQALIRTELQQPRAPEAPTAPASYGNNGRSTKQAPTPQGLTIRGLAGPYVVLAQNFAPGTTAADIESALTPIGGLIERCRIIKTTPIVIAEITFESKEGAENVVATLDGQTADGRILKVFHKPGVTAAPDRQHKAPSAPRSTRDDPAVVDGSLGFDDPMETDNYSSGNGRQPPRGPAADTGGLYSDNLVRENRRGRGFGRGGW